MCGMWKGGEKQPLGNLCPRCEKWLLEVRPNAVAFCHLNTMQESSPKD